MWCTNTVIGAWIQLYLNFRNLGILFWECLSIFSFSAIWFPVLVVLVHFSFWKAKFLKVWLCPLFSTAILFTIRQVFHFSACICSEMEKKMSLETYITFLFLFISKWYLIQHYTVLFFFFLIITARQYVILDFSLKLFFRYNCNRILAHFFHF